MRLVENGEFSRAEPEFARALALEPDFGPGWAGLALVHAYRTHMATDPGRARAEAEAALDLLDKADSKCRADNERFVFHVTSLRVYQTLRTDHWLDRCERAYDRALDCEGLGPDMLPHYRDQGAAHLFFGRALLLAGEYVEAQNVLSRAVGSPSVWKGAASDLYAKAQKIDRAQAQFSLTGLARAVAVQDVVQRADAAALVVNELHPDRLFSGGPLVGGHPIQAAVPADVAGHPMENAIMNVVAWRIRGLEPLYEPSAHAYLFEPARPLTRKELAFFLEDVVLRATRDDGLATRYYSDADSPFPDVPVTAPWYNAAVTAVGRGLMQPELNGDFRPDGYVDGADLVLAVLKLRQAVAR